MGQRLRKKQIVEQDVWTLALDRMRRVYDLFDEVVISFSGGKDSTVVLNLALEVAEERNRLPLRVVFYDEEAIPWETVDYVDRVAADPRVALEWYSLPLECRNACSRKEPFWYPWAPEDEDRWVRPMHPRAITSHPTLEGLDRGERPGWAEWAPTLAGTSGSTAFVLGIRADESLMRQAQVTMRKTDNYIINYAPGVAKAMPIYDFRTEDVWTAPLVKGWDYNRAYDSMEMLGIPPATQRCAPPFGEEPIHNLWMFAQAFPDIWDRMTDRVPGATTAARYSKTELYGFGGGLEKPDSMTWPEYIKWLLEKHPASVRAAAASSVAGMIDNHYKRVTTPIAIQARHPATGVSWRRIASVAMRGDLKGRRSMSSGYINPGTPEWDRKIAQYEAELQVLAAEDRLGEITL